jgi:hypothetical protein
MRELDDAALERRLRGVLKEHLEALPLDLTVDDLDRRREAKGVARGSGRGRGMTLLAAAALLLVGGALAAGSGILRLPTVVPPVPEPSVVAVATASPDATSPSPSATPTAPPGPSDCAVPSSDPSEPVGPVAWTPESLDEDWPAPVRAEAADESVQPMPPTYRDPTGDTGSDGFPCVDIRWLMADTSEVHLKLVSKPPPWSCSETRECFGVDPTEQWIAYGVVTDEDADGVPDWRYGTDNMPADAVEKGPPRRGWRTNLHTGQTEAGPGLHDPLFLNGGGFWSGLPTDSSDWEPDATFGFGGTLDTTQGLQRWGFELDMPFYTWASVIVDGRVVATDYAPDSGWLVATPGVAITPNQFPGGPYLLEVEYDNTDSALSRPLRASMTVPHGWTVGGPWAESDGGNTSLDFTVVGHPWDGCPDTVEPTLGPGFDDLVSYLEALPRIEVSEIRYGTIDGHRTAYLEYRPADGHFDCMSGSPIPLEPGNNDAWIVDVNGVRLVITAWSDEAPSEAVSSEVRQIVESIRIVGVPPSLPASPSPTPSPTPTPTPFAPEAGPVPPNARTWKVTVDNQSSEPAALFVAEGDEGGTFRLVGSATPNVVPARTTVKVTFQLPAEGDPDGGWIYVNPGPDSGGLFPSTDLPPAGKILIMADGQGGWLSP